MPPVSLNSYQNRKRLISFLFCYPMKKVCSTISLTFKYLKKVTRIVSYKPFLSIFLYPLRIHLNISTETEYFKKQKNKNKGNFKEIKKLK